MNSYLKAQAIFFRVLFSVVILRNVKKYFKRSEGIALSKWYSVLPEKISDGMEGAGVKENLVQH